MFHSVNAHVARFSKHTCKIEVTVGASASGPPPIFVAEAFVREPVGRELRPVVWRPGEAVAIHSDTEGQAVSGILRVLEHHLGPLEELVSASGFCDPEQFKGDPWPLLSADRNADRLSARNGAGPGGVQACPICQSGSARWLEAVSEPAWVNYYRCRACGHLWSIPKPKSGPRNI
jgi:hypothetical protein